ncbi:MAG TPA: hypothetical protein VND89_06540 [Acidimicrobiales bacterium]|nr:hypothetical protein [Acidimicrobiales bacterium]
MHSEHWKLEPEAHDYPAAATYLSLVGDVSLASAIAKLFQGAPTVIYEAKDLLRASQLALLPRDNVHVAKDLGQVRNGHKLSPVLIVRGKFLKGRPLVVADGYHRVCASYWIDENAQIPCRLVDAPS